MLQSTNDKQSAVRVPLVDAGGYYTGTEVETALQEAGNGSLDYLYKPGIAGGQTAIGGTLTTQTLILQDNVVDANQITFGPGLSGGLLNGQAGGNDTSWRHIGLGAARPPTNTHMLIGSEVFTTPSVSIVGLGLFPDYRPSSSGGNSLIPVQGNAWFATTNWGPASSIRCLDFFPAPQFVAGGPFGSSNLDITGIATSGLLNVAGQTIVANTVQAISCAPTSNIFGGTDNLSASIVRGINIPSAAATTGTWGRLTGIQIDPQTSGVVNHGIWLKGDGFGSCLCLGAGLTVNPDARIYYDGSNLIVDPNVTGGGIVLIGATGNDSMRLANIEIDGALNHDGATVGFYGTAPAAQSAAYTPTNVVADRAYDANATTVNELADVLGTLIADLQNVGLLG